MTTLFSHPSNRARRRLPAVVLGLGIALAAVTGCGADTSSTTDAGSTTSAASTAADDTANTADTADIPTTTDTEAAVLSIKDPWIKTAASGMTAAFGTLVNNGDSDIVVVSATSEVTTSMELHETVANDDGSMAMQPKQGGFTIPAGGTHELSPGGDHLMVMDLTRPLEPGENVIIRLELKDGSTMEVDATAKDFSGADEKYQNGDMSDMSSDMDMSDMGGQ